MYLVKFPGDGSIENSGAVFSREVSLAEGNPLALINSPANLLIGQDELDDRRLNLCVQAYALAAGQEDITWSGVTNKLEGTANFWRSLRAADFRHLEQVYRSRILRTLTQIALGIDLDIHAHGMNNQSFTYSGKSIGKWNAYVFQSGADDQDRRCSRIYYGYVAGAVVLHEYDPDAH